MYCPDCDIEFSGSFCPNCGMKIEASGHAAASHGKPNFGQMAGFLSNASKNRSAGSGRSRSDSSSRSAGSSRSVSSSRSASSNRSTGKSRFRGAATVGFTSASANQPIKKESRAKGRTELLILVVVLVAAISIEAAIFDAQKTHPTKPASSPSWTTPGWVQDIYEWFTSDGETPHKPSSKREGPTSSEVDGVTLYYPDESCMSSSLLNVDDETRAANKRKSIKQQLMDTEAWSKEQAEDVQRILLKVGLDDFELVSGPYSAKAEYPYIVAFCYGHDVWINMTKHGVDLVEIYMTNYNETTSDEDVDSETLYFASSEGDEDDEDACFEMRFDPKTNTCVPFE